MTEYGDSDFLRALDRELQALTHPQRGSVGRTSEAAEPDAAHPWPTVHGFVARSILEYELTRCRTATIAGQDLDILRNDGSTRRVVGAADLLAREVIAEAEQILLSVSSGRG